MRIISVPFSFIVAVWAALATAMIVVGIYQTALYHHVPGHTDSWPLMIIAGAAGLGLALCVAWDLADE